MLPNFNQIFPALPNHSKVWLYLAERKLDSTETFFVEEKIGLFVQTWTAHNKQLRAEGTLLFNQYIILAVDEQVESASGCSIDSSVRMVKSLSQELGVDFFNRMNVLGFVNNEWKTLNYFDATNKGLIYLNPLVQNLGELRGNWVMNLVTA